MPKVESSATSLQRAPSQHHTTHFAISASFFKIKCINFFGYFDPENIFIDNENTYVWDVVTDISVKKEALFAICESHTVPLESFCTVLSTLLLSSGCSLT